MLDDCEFSKHIVTITVLAFISPFILTFYVKICSDYLLSVPTLFPIVISDKKFTHKADYNMSNEII